MRTFQEDYEFGIEGEVIVKGALDVLFGPSKKLGPTHSMDLEGDNYFSEIKRRTNKKAQYPTTIIPEHKLRFAEEQTKDVYFVFMFTDGIEYIKYNKEKFSEFFIEKGFCRRWKRTNDKPTAHIHIPIDELKPLVVD